MSRVEWIKTTQIFNMWELAFILLCYNQCARRPCSVCTFVYSIHRHCHLPSSIICMCALLSYSTCGSLRIFSHFCRRGLFVAWSNMGKIFSKSERSCCLTRKLWVFALVKLISQAHYWFVIFLLQSFLSSEWCVHHFYHNRWRMSLSVPLLMGL